MVDEIQRRHAQVAGIAEQQFSLADAQNDRQQTVVPHKRTLDSDDEVYAKKLQILRQIKQETAGTELAVIKQHDP